MLFHSEPEKFLHILHLSAIISLPCRQLHYGITCHIYIYIHGVVQYIRICNHQLIVLLKVSLQLYSIQQAANLYKACLSKHASNQDISKQTLADYGQIYHTASYIQAPCITNSYNDVLFQQRFCERITCKTDTSHGTACFVPEE